jgi:hypothetical protein
MDSMYSARQKYNQQSLMSPVRSKYDSIHVQGTLPSCRRYIAVMSGIRAVDILVTFRICGRHVDVREPV